MQEQSYLKYFLEKPHEDHVAYIASKTRPSEVAYIQNTPNRWNPFVAGNVLFCNDVLLQDEKFQRLVKTQVAVEQANGEIILHQFFSIFIVVEGSIMA